MSDLFQNQQKMTELIFLERNKKYGAYILRSEYGFTLFKSLFCMMFFSISIASIALYLNKKEPKPVETKLSLLPTNDSVYVIPFNAKKDLPIPADVKNKITLTKEGVNHNNAIVKVVDSILTVSDTSTHLLNSASSNQSHSTDTEAENASGNDQSNNKGNEGGSVLLSQPYESYAIDTEPEFEGGLSALVRLISENLRYPEPARTEGKEGKIVIRFILDESGRVTKPQVVHSLGFGLDEEALRVVSLIPKFKSPARVKGRAVKTFYVLPIKFRLSQ